MGDRKTLPEEERRSAKGSDLVKDEEDGELRSWEATRRGLSGCNSRLLDKVASVVLDSKNNNILMSKILFGFFYFITITGM